MHAGSADDIERFETYLYIMKRTRRSFILQAARIPPGHPTAAVVRSGFGTKRSLGGIYLRRRLKRIVAVPYTCVYDTCIREYILYIICKYWPRVFMPKECACHGVLCIRRYIYVYIRIISYNNIRNIRVHRRRWMPSKLCA